MGQNHCPQRQGEKPGTMLCELCDFFTCRPFAQDYMVAEGYDDPLLGLGGAVQFDSKFYYSLDGVKWVDLQAVDEETAARAATVLSILIGDPAKAYEMMEDDPNAPAAPAPGEEGEPAPEGEEGGPKKLTFQIAELAVLRQRIDSINTACGVVPVVRSRPPCMPACVLVLPIRQRHC